MDNTDIDSIIEWFKTLQESICSELEAMDGTGKFIEDKWARAEGGGGRSRVIEGTHIEKGGVMFSAVSGVLPESIAKGIGISTSQFNATGVSIVLHPSNPWVPIIHMNVRYFETAEGLWWFGGGIDLTPHYINPSEARVFHNKLKKACDELSPVAYGQYKKWADEYFYNVHRQETRGVGGIFFDQLNEKSNHDKVRCWQFVKSIGSSFIECYSDILKNNCNREYTSEHKKWQKIRRGRYVEFNLVYDRGTKFGLQTNGRIESILVSMPPEANWVYSYIPSEGSEEYKTQKLLKKGIDWLNYNGV